MKISFPPPYAHPPLKVTYYIDKNPAPANATPRWFYPTKRP